MPPLELNKDDERFHDNKDMEAETTNEFDQPSSDRQGGGCWISKEQEDELLRSYVNPDLPKVSDWIEDEGEHDIISLHFDQGRTVLWNQAKEEIKVAREKLGPSPNIDKVFEKIFGKSSDVFQIFEKDLDMNYETFCRFVATLLLSSQYKVTYGNLETDDCVCTNAYLSNKEYCRIWKRIANCGKSRNQKYFWMKMEDAFNQDMKDLFVSDSDSFRFLCTFDDDKLHYNWGRNTMSKGLKRVHHARDNRHGFTFKPQHSQQQ